MTVILRGDCRDVLASLALNGEAFDSCVTDPPYELGFLGKKWDNTGVAFQVETWRAVFDVLKPGAHLLAFGGTRTYHRMACAIEDAGFEIRDCVMFLYGTGFPKSLDVSKAIDKAAGAEREVVGYGKGKGGENLNKLARPDRGDDADAKGCGAYGQGAKQIDIEIPITAPATNEARQWAGWGTSLKPAYEPIIVARKPLLGTTVAANVLAYGTGALNIDACRVAMGDEYDATKTQRQQNANGAVQFGAAGLIGKEIPTYNAAGRWPANIILDGSDEVLAEFAKFGERGDTGTAARFFKSCEPDCLQGASRFHYSSKASAKDRAGSKHPTVKPVALMRYLCRLVTPPGGTVLDPFAGSGTTLQAAVEEGFQAVGIEREAEYVRDIKRRLAKLQPALV